MILILKTFYPNKQHFCTKNPETGETEKTLGSKFTKNFVSYFQEIFGIQNFVVFK